MGCLVTDKPEFGEQNIPASLRVLQPASFTRVTPVDDPLCPTRSTTGSVSIAKQQMGFEVEVSDANIADKLEVRLFVNGIKDRGEDDVPTTGQVSRGSKRICVLKGTLNNSCNHVELVVSRGFKGDGPYDVTDSTDVAVAEWWVLPAASLDPTANGDACATDIDAGVL